jgi:hypothetical protein
LLLDDSPLDDLGPLGRRHGLELSCGVALRHAHRLDDDSDSRGPVERGTVTAHRLLVAADSNRQPQGSPDHTVDARPAVQANLSGPTNEPRTLPKLTTRVRFSSPAQPPHQGNHRTSRRFDHFGNGRLCPCVSLDRNRT